MSDVERGKLCEGESLAWLLVHSCLYTPCTCLELLFAENLLMRNSADQQDLPRGFVHLIIRQESVMLSQDPGGVDLEV